LISQVHRDDEPYPTYPEGYDYSSDSYLPSPEEAKGVQDSYQKEKH